MARYRASGSGATISTSNPIVNWGMNTCEGASEPQYHKGEYPSDRITHKWPAPKGENFSRNDKTPAKYSPSGSNYFTDSRRGSGSGPTAAPGISTKKGSTPSIGSGLGSRRMKPARDV
jgi:hypothetical protein